jgi:hypothetical protein
MQATAHGQASNLMTDKNTLKKNDAYNDDEHAGSI